MKKEIGEILVEAQEISKQEERIKFLQENDSIPLQQIFQLAYDDRLEWLLPTEEAPPYTPSDPHNHPSSFRRDFKLMGKFIKGHGYDNMPQLKRESQFIALLEGLHPECAKALVACLDGSFSKKYTKLSRALVLKLYPGLLGEKKE